MPQAFEREFNEALKRKHLITEQDLRQFWLFAVQQGLDNYESRDFIARLVVGDASITGYEISFQRTKSSSATKRCFIALNIFF